MLLAEIAHASTDVAATSSRLAKIARLADCLAQATPEEVAIAVAYLSGELPQGTVGVGWAALRDLPAPAASRRRSSCSRSMRRSTRLQAISGRGLAGSSAKRARRRSSSRATEPEQRLLAGLFLGELRQGALEGVMTDAVAKAADVPAAAVRRAAMLAGDLSTRRGGRRCARASTVSGASGSRRCGRSRRCSPRPPTTCPARSSGSVAASVEWKLDGARIQVHRAGDEVRVFTRNLADITERVPEIVEAVRALAVLGDRARRRGDRAPRRTAARSRSR